MGIILRYANPQMLRVHTSVFIGVECRVTVHTSIQPSLPFTPVTVLVITSLQHTEGRVFYNGISLL